MKTINETFTDEEHEELLQAKDDFAYDAGLDKLSWHDYMLAVAREKKK